MDKKTKEALEASIIKWRNIADGTQVDIGAQNCDLCKLFFKYKCVGCPVFLKTAHSDCISTPFYEWKRHFIYEHPLYKGDRRVICETCKNIALEEVKFLESLKEKEFKPIEITFNFKNINEIKNMWLRLNIAENAVIKFYKEHYGKDITLEKNNDDLWNELDDFARFKGIDPQSFKS